MNRCHLIHSITATKTIEKLGIIFALHGTPHSIVTDSGPPFTGGEFKTFMAHNGIAHVTTTPYHLSSNGWSHNGIAHVTTDPFHP